MKQFFSTTRQILVGLTLGLVLATSANAQAFSDYMENKLIDHVFRAQTTPAVATMHVALFTAASACDAGTVTEVTGGNYARVSVGSSLANWAGTQSAGSTTASTGTGGVTSNNGAISFGTVTWTATVTHWGLYDASTAGNLLFCAALTASQGVSSGNTVQFAAAALTVTLQ